MSNQRWPKKQAQAWYEQQPWLVGCNFIPSTAINQIEMWQSQTFDRDTLERELGWAASLGFNTVRVFLHNLVWQVDAAGFKSRIDHYLKIAEGFAIRTLFVLFDDCWNDNPQPGPQPQPIPGVHNSGWMRSPGSALVTDPKRWTQLEDYLTDVIGTFAQDGRILMWDMYNEPGNEGLGTKSIPLLKKAFEWARAVEPMQPLTTGVYSDNQELNTVQLEIADIVTFHNYRDAASLTQQIQELKARGRPVICTEYMARTRESRFETHLPVFKRERVGCYNWGLVKGKTQTIYPWGSKPGASEPGIWFHDVLREDGTPFNDAEVNFIKSITHSP
jgi:hypothetical protein